MFLKDLNWICIFYFVFEMELDGRGDGEKLGGEGGEIVIGIYYVR